MSRLSAGLRLATRRINRAATTRPMLFFEPSPALRVFAASNEPRILVRAANRVGKTRHAAYKMARYMREHPGSRCRAVGPTNRQANNVLARYLNDFLKEDLRRGSYWTEGRGYNANNTAVLGNGSICQIMSYEQAPDAHAGDELDVVWLDEPPTQPIFQETLARVLSRNGAVWCTLTAVGRPVKWLRQIVEADDSPWNQHVVAFSREAAPWYSRKQVDDWLKEMTASPWQYAQRIQGAWEGVTDDRCLSAFSDSSVLPLSVGTRSGWEPGRQVHSALVVDHGEKAGHSAWLLFAWQVVRRTVSGPVLRIRILDEWTNPKRMSDRTEARAVADRVRANGLELGDLDFAVGDINSAGKSAGGRSLNESYELIFAEMMGRAGAPTLQFRPAIKGTDSINAGLIRCNQLLDSGALTVSEQCQQLVEAASHWAGKDDDLKHIIDALRYGVTAILEETGADPARIAA